MKQSSSVIILGAGPSGLGAGYELAKNGQNVTIFDRHSQVGGLARSIVHKGNRFDVGPHRFYTKEPLIIALWEETLGQDFLHVPRLTRIYYRNKFFDYPIKAGNVLKNLGPFTTVAMLWSYLVASLKRKKTALTFEDWVSQKFGRQLYQTFFKTYTEKVWGVPCDQIDAKWAAQRIKGLNLREVVTDALSLNKGKVRSLINEFRYPKHGAGMMYETMATNLQQQGSQIELQHRVVEVRHQQNRISAVVLQTPNGKKTVKTDQLFTSIPITEFVSILKPPAPPAVLKAAKELRYRDHLTVNLLIKGEAPFPDNWIYIHSPEVLMARISNYNTFSAHMTASPNQVAISCEYFCFRDEPIWQKTDQELVRFAVSELAKLELVKPASVVHGFVIRELDSYPLYYLGYQQPFERMKAYLEKFKNLSLIGRAGMFKYNNMDHALLSGIYAAKNYFGERHDTWGINEDSDYLEEQKQGQ